MKIEITGIEANLLLFALDAYLLVNVHGKVLKSKDGYTREELQALRDRLMAIHEHPKGK
jgi:hypothetical protein